MEEKRRGMGEHRRRAICNSCRKRKSKCDSRQPQCSTCVAHNTACHYEKPPSLAYVRSLEARIESLLLERSLNYENREIDDHENDMGGSQHAGHTAVISISPSENATGVNTSPDRIVEVDSQGDKEENGWVSQISVNSHGGVSFHNSTSAIHEALSPDDSANSRNGKSIHIDGDGIEEQARARLSLVSNAATQKHLEALAVQNMTTSQIQLSSTLVTEFLNFHWCWIYPMFMFVYRPAFTRKFTCISQSETSANFLVGDMALSSTTRAVTPYFSETLLKVLLAHSARFHIRDSQQKDAASARMRTLTQQAHLSLAMETTNASSISTVQALLQQSARDVAFGNSSQAWLYSGMAFRIAIDLGINLPSEKLSGYVRNFSVEDVEIRKRLFWSCYTWDKAISLYLGRMPAFIPAMKSNMPVFMDDFTENEPWEPYYGSVGNNATLHPDYPPQKGHMVSCFTGLCQLSMILSSIMLEIYGSSSGDPIYGNTSYTRSIPASQQARSSKNSAFVKIASSIHNWWIALPDPIRLHPKNLPTVSPPLHIVSLNLLYHTTLILLHRPFINGATDFTNDAVIRSYQICASATASIYDLLQILTFTFGFGHTTYLNCYSTYIAATIAVLHFQMQDETTVLPKTDVPADKLELKFFLDVLQKSATAMPGLNRSIGIIKRHIQAILDRRSKSFLKSLFSTSNPDQPNTEATSDTNSTATRSQPHAFAIGTSPSFMNLPPIDDSYQSYPGENFEDLPAFPGQNFNMGTNFNSDQEITDPEMRAAFLGLDPHLTLQHENSDWACGGYFVGDEMK